MLPSPGCFYFTDLLLLRPLQHHPILISIPSITSIIAYPRLSSPIISYHLLLSPTISYYLLPSPIISYHLLSFPIISYYLLLSPISTYLHLSPSIKFFANIIMCTAVLSLYFVNISENFYKN